MKTIKALLVAAMLFLPVAAFALEGEQQVEFTEALSSGNLKIVKKYFDEGVGVNDLYFAWSALQIAANKNQLGVVKFLVEKGADLNYVHPATKMSALHLAAFDGYAEVTKYLVSKGGDPNLKLRGGVSILRAVHDKGDEKMENLLISLGAKDDGCKEEKCF